jgi:hypothetical protein
MNVIIFIIDLVNLPLGTQFLKRLVFPSLKLKTVCSLKIRSFINGSTALFGALPLLQFRNLFYTDGRAPWTGEAIPLR